jgi:transcriptional regulator with XRE-family HTH domain
MTSTHLSDRLKSLRISHNLTQKELGAYLNVTRQAYSHYENGTRVPDFQTLELLAQLYHVSIDYLLTSYHSEAFLPGNQVEETYEASALEGLTKEEQTLLSLFSSLPNEEKEDFMDLISVKYHQTKLRQNIRLARQRKRKQPKQD